VWGGKNKTRGGKPFRGVTKGKEAGVEGQKGGLLGKKKKGGNVQKTRDGGVGSDAQQGFTGARGE